jgi:hypothetical protein
VTIGTGFPIYEGGEEGLLPSVNILRFHRSYSCIYYPNHLLTKVSSDLIPAAPLWLRDRLWALVHWGSSLAVDRLVMGIARPSGTAAMERDGTSYALQAS